MYWMTTKKKKNQEEIQCIFRSVRPFWHIILLVDGTQQNLVFMYKDWDSIAVSVFVQHQKLRRGPCLHRSFLSLQLAFQRQPSGLSKTSLACGFLQQSAVLMTPLSVWHRREQILPSHSTRVKTNICANRHGQEHIFGTIIQALQSMSAESVTDVIIFYWITETQISFFFTSPVKVKCSQLLHL